VERLDAAGSELRSCDQSAVILCCQFHVQYMFWSSRRKKMHGKRDRLCCSC